jgi:hypothetical protein
MLYTKVVREQFLMSENEIVHMPTGARFNAYPGIAEPHSVKWGRAGDVLPNGEDFSRGAIQAMACS